VSTTAGGDGMDTIIGLAVGIIGTMVLLVTHMLSWNDGHRVGRREARRG
jgi:hypothetical protein